MCTIWNKWKYRRQVVSNGVRQRDPRFSVFDRHERIPGFYQRNLTDATGVFIGAGGINSVTGQGLCQKGLGGGIFLDHDRIEDVNLSRQLFFDRKWDSDIGKPKAWRIIRNLKKHCTARTVLTGYYLRFQDALALGMDFSDTTFFVCGVDNGEARVAASRYFRARGIPGVFVAVSLDAQAGYTFVQGAGPDDACFGCLFHRDPVGRPAPCRTPACIDILNAVGGMALYAIDSLIMDRKRNWNFRTLQLAGFMPDDLRMVERNPNCPLCHE